MTLISHNKDQWSLNNTVQAVVIRLLCCGAFWISWCCCPLCSWSWRGCRSSSFLGWRSLWACLLADWSVVSSTRPPPHGRQVGNHSVARRRLYEVLCHKNINCEFSLLRMGKIVCGVLIVLVKHHGLQSEHEAHHSGASNNTCCCPPCLLRSKGEVAWFLSEGGEL